jgi:hypothetical protein
MTTHDALLPATVLQRKAVVYVRQSTPQQVQANRADTVSHRWISMERGFA